MNAMRTPFAVATPTQANLLARIDQGEMIGSRFIGTPREHWIDWDCTQVRYVLTDAGRVALELATLAPNITRVGARALKYGPPEEDFTGWPQAQAALQRAGLWELGSPTEQGRKVMLILRKYDVGV